MEIHQIVISSVIAGALLIGLIAFIKTPSSKRWTTKQTEKEPGVEYAPIYTRREKIRLVVIRFLWAVPFVLFLNFLFFPLLREYSENANCYNYGSINGVHIVFYGVFVGIPLCIALMIYLFEGKSAISAFRAAQFPAPNQKVFDLTPYKYGSSAKRRAILPFVAIAGFVGVSIWGGFQALTLTDKIQPCNASSPRPYTSTPLLSHQGKTRLKHNVMAHIQVDTNGNIC